VNLIGFYQSGRYKFKFRTTDGGPTEFFRQKSQKSPQNFNKKNIGFSVNGTNTFSTLYLESNKGESSNDHKKKLSYFEKKLKAAAGV
jgi:hypothetical protein